MTTERPNDEDRCFYAVTHEGVTVPCLVERKVHAAFVSSHPFTEAPPVRGDVEQKPNNSPVYRAVRFLRHHHPDHDVTDGLARYLSEIADITDVLRDTESGGAKIVEPPVAADGSQSKGTITSNESP